MDLLTPTDVAQRLQVSRAWVDRRIHEGDLPFRRYGRLLRISEDDFKAWCDSRETTAAPSMREKGTHAREGGLRTEADDR